MNTTSFYAIVATLVLIMSSVTGYIVYTNSKEVSKEEDTHYHAGFQVYIGDQLMDFSDDKFMHFAPCSIEEEHEEIVDVKDKVHLHNNVGDVAHIHTEGVTWADLFTSLEFEMPKDNVNYYLDGEPAIDLLEKTIEEYSSATFVMGEIGDIQTALDTRVTQDQIIKAEKDIENCGE